MVQNVNGNIQGLTRSPEGESACHILGSGEGEDNDDGDTGTGREGGDTAASVCL